MDSEKVKIEYIDGGTLYIRLYGDIDHHSAKSIREKIDKELFLYHAKMTLLDLSSVDFMDSSGLGLILGRYTKAIELGGKMKICNPTERIDKILSLAGTDKIIQIERNGK